MLENIYEKNDEAILLEGFMDVIKSDSSGLKPVIASMGTNISDEHITVLKKLTSHITLMFDGDFVKKQQLKLGNTFYNKDSMFLLFNYLKIWIQMSI